ncbi:MAG: cell division protein ZapE, partial [Nitrospirae bacterium]
AHPHPQGLADLPVGLAPHVVPRKQLPVPWLQTLHRLPYHTPQLRRRHPGLRPRGRVRHLEGRPLVAPRRHRRPPPPGAEAVPGEIAHQGPQVAHEAPLAAPGAQPPPLPLPEAAEDLLEELLRLLALQAEVAHQDRPDEARVPLREAARGRRVPRGHRPDQLRLALHPAPAAPLKAHGRRHGKGAPAPVRKAPVGRLEGERRPPAEGPQTPEAAPEEGRREGFRELEDPLEARIPAELDPPLDLAVEVDAFHEPQLDRERIRQLAHADWVAAAEPILFAGPVGTGKTHLAIALGIEATKCKDRVGFHRADDLVRSLTEAQAGHGLTPLLPRLERLDVLLVDELGVVPFDRTGAELLFNLLARRYQRRATVVTTNLAFSEWVKVFGDEKLTAALLDRLGDRAHVIPTAGPSYPMRGTPDLPAADPTS